MLAVSYSRPINDPSLRMFGDDAISFGATTKKFVHYLAGWVNPGTELSKGRVGPVGGTGTERTDASWDTVKAREFLTSEAEAQSATDQITAQTKSRRGRWIRLRNYQETRARYD